MTAANFEMTFQYLRHEYKSGSAADKDDFLIRVLAALNIGLDSLAITDCEVFNEASYWYAKTEFDKQIWEWAVRLAKITSLEKRHSLAIGFFDLLLEGVPDIRDLCRIWDLWFDSDTMWVLPIVYNFRRDALWFDMDRVTDAKMNEQANQARTGQ